MGNDGKFLKEKLIGSLFTDEAVEEEDTEADLVGGPPVALNSMTSSLSVGADPTENVGRGDTITLSMSFALQNTAIPMAQAI